MKIPDLLGKDREAVKKKTVKKAARLTALVDTTLCTALSACYSRYFPENYFIKSDEIYGT